MAEGLLKVTAWASFLFFSSVEGRLIISPKKVFEYHRSKSKQYADLSARLHPEQCQPSCPSCPEGPGPGRKTSNFSDLCGLHVNVEV